MLYLIPDPPPRGSVRNAIVKSLCVSEVQVLRETHDDLRAQVMGAMQIREPKAVACYIFFIFSHS